MRALQTSRLLAAGSQLPSLGTYNLKEKCNFCREPPFQLKRSTTTEPWDYGGAEVKTLIAT